MSLLPAVFLDRDGVINIEKKYLHRICDFEFLPNVLATCRKINQAGYKIIVITNQSGIARGYYSDADFQELTTWMLSVFKEHNVDIAGVYYCPHHPSYSEGECECRKPNPGMILKAAREHGIDLQRSIMVGDKISDAKAGRNANIGKCFLITTGHSFVLNEDNKDYVDAVLSDISDLEAVL